MKIMQRVGSWLCCLSLVLLFVAVPSSVSADSTLLYSYSFVEGGLFIADNSAVPALGDYNAVFTAHLDGDSLVYYDGVLSVTLLDLDGLSAPSAFFSVNDNSFNFIWAADVPDVGINGFETSAFNGADQMYFTLSLSPVGGEDPPAASAGLMSDLRLTGTAFLDTVVGITNAIVINPLLLLTVGIFFLGACIAIFGRFVSRE